MSDQERLEEATQWLLEQGPDVQERVGLLMGAAANIGALEYVQAALEAEIAREQGRMEA